MANFTTDSIIIIQKQEVISIEDIHILKPPCQESRIRLLLATLRLCARCLILKLPFSYLPNRRLRGCLLDGRNNDFDVLKYQSLG